MKKLIRFTIVILVLTIPCRLFAWPGMPTPALHVEGRYLKDPCGNKVLLHGVAMTPSPWFNGCSLGTCRWNNYDVNGCLTYNNAVMDKLTNVSEGWYLNYIRLHIDPYWSNNGQSTGENDISKFDFNRFTAAVDNVIIPLIEHARSRGMYVILRPPGVCPDKIDTNDAYNKYLLIVWSYLSKHPKLKNANNVMFELANEPIQILGTDGVYASGTQAAADKLKMFFQPIVDSIRANDANNVIWIPGLGWQSQYSGLANNPIRGTNVGYAVHIYPGYWGQDNNDPTKFRSNWNKNIKPIADIAPVAVTEIDWGPSQYPVWGKGGVTGTAGQWGFGANFKMLADESGNVSWNLLAPEDLIDKGDPLGGIAFNNDPEACANPSYKWFKEYSSSNLPAATCSGDSVVTAVADIPGSSPTIQIYPNPSATGHFNIFISGLNGQRFSLSIVNAAGAKIYEKEGLKSGNNYLAAALRKGMYVLQLKSGNNSFTRKLVVQ